MKRIIKLLCLSGTTFGLGAQALLAQSTADLIDPVDLGKLILNAAPSDPVPGYVADRSATASKSGTPILEIPQSVSVVTGEQIEDQGATTLGDTLGYSAGVFAQPFGTDPRFDSPTIRGFNGSEAQYLNGLRILRNLGAPSFEIYSLERVEILKGPASVLYGSGSPGGVINQVQKRAQFLTFGEAGVGLGDPQATEAFVDWNAAVSDTFAARITAVARDSEEDVEELEQQRRYLGLATRWSITPSTELQFLGSYQEDDPITPAGVPFDLVGTGIDEQLRDSYAGDPTDDRSERKNLNLGFQMRHDLDNNWALDANFRYQNFDWDYTGFFVQNAVADGDTINRGGINQLEDSETVNLDLRLSGTVETGAVTHDLLFGMEYLRYDLVDRTEFLNANPISLSNPVRTGADLRGPTFFIVNDLVQEQVAFYAQDEFSTGNWRGSLAIRHDRSEIKGRSGNSLGISEIDQDDTETTGRIGLSYVFDNGVAPYGSYTTSFDPEIGSDIDGNALKPTEGEQWEVGLKWQPDGLDALFTAAIYDLRQQNIPNTVTEGTATGTRQIGEAHSRGLELEGTIDLNNGWSIRGQYTYNQTKVLSGVNEGNELPNAPEQSFGLFANYAFDGGSQLGGLELGGGVRFIDNRFGDAGNTLGLEGVTLLDVRASYQVRENLNMSLNITNLTDQAYVANCGPFGCFFGDGRTLQARVTYQW
ncbi:TonB-dependent siderophore receptor [Tateyamaria sp. syn59]|uniref:TonB-dependent siderophore receptor n=1 Tax=Tateyamaria sp. syn59 TaxID=2576942 RepID=UPI0011BD9A3F|nr:TonB-dependent siderophore receptor [Tateyamaria sp. syn59]